MLSLLGLRVVLGALALLVHQPAELVLVDAEPLLGRHLEGEVDREAVGVVQGERLVAGQPGAAGPLHRSRRLVEDRGARPQRLAERVLLGVGDGGDPFPVVVQLGVGLPILSRLIGSSSGSAGSS